MSKQTWIDLNKTLRQTTSEDAVLKLFELEKQHRPKRPQFLRRIWARYSRLRAQREKKALVRY